MYKFETEKGNKITLKNLLVDTEGRERIEIKVNEKKFVKGDIFFEKNSVRAYNVSLGKHFAVRLPKEIAAELKSKVEKIKEERKKKEEEIAEKIVKGEIKIPFILVGCEYPRFVIPSSFLNGRNKENILAIAIKKLLPDKLFASSVLYLQDMLLADKLDENKEISIQQLLEKQILATNKKNKKEEELRKKARETGERQLLNSYMEECNDPNEECDIDIICEYITPDGKIVTEKHHTW